jgi:hypothetical protein
VARCPEPACAVGGDVGVGGQQIGIEGNDVVLAPVVTIVGVIGPAGDLDQPAAFETQAVAELSVAEIGTAPIGGAACQLGSVTQTATFMAKLREKKGLTKRGIDLIGIS